MARNLGAHRPSRTGQWTDWHVRRTVIAYRVKALLAGQDPGGAFLLMHHLAWTFVLILPGATLAARPGQPSSVGLFLALGGDLALAALYGLLSVLCLVAVTRLTLSTEVTRSCLLGVLCLSVPLAVVYFVGNPLSIIAWDALLRAVLAWWAYTGIDEDR